MHRAPLAASIRHCRIAAGLTLEELAARARVSRSTLAKIEAGDTADPGFGVVARLMTAAGATDQDMLHLVRTVVASPVPRAVGIGYEGLDQAQLIEQLRSHHVDVVADVRRTPLSRKPGLSKTALTLGLRASRIDYVHLPALGNPKHNRPGYADRHNSQARDAFRDILRTEPGLTQLAELRTLASQRVVAVLCFEQNQTLCHREQVLAAL